MDKKTLDSTTARQTKRPCKGPRESYSGGPGGRANPTRKLRPLSAPTGPRAQRRVGVRAAMPCRANKSVDSAKEAKEAALVAQWLRRRTSETQVPRSNPSQHANHFISHIPYPGRPLSSPTAAHIPYPIRRPALKSANSHQPHARFRAPAGPYVRESHHLSSVQSVQFSQSVRPVGATPTISRGRKGLW